MLGQVGFAPGENLFEGKLCRFAGAFRFNAWAAPANPGEESRSVYPEHLGRSILGKIHPRDLLVVVANYYHHTFLPHLGNNRVCLYPY